MYDIELLYHALNRIAGAIERIINNSKDIDDPQYYLLSPAGMERLESTCMLLLAIGESIKGIDKMTQKTFLPTYPDVDWKELWASVTLSHTTILTLTKPLSLMLSKTNFLIC